MKEEFDDILKRKWEQQYFPVDESHREDMIALLDGKKKRKAVPFWWIGGLGMAAIIAGFFLLADSVETTTSTNVKPVEKLNNHNADGNSTSSSIMDPSSVSESSSLNAQPTKEGQLADGTSPANASSAIQEEERNKPVYSKTKSTASIPKPTEGKTGTKKSATQGNEVKPSEPIATNPPGAEVDAKGIGSTPAGVFQVDEEAAKSFQIVSKAVAVTIEPATREDIYVEEIFLPDFTGIRYAKNAPPALVPAKATFHRSFFLFGETGLGMILASKPDFTSGWKFRAGGGVGYRQSPKLEINLSAGYLLQAGGFNFQRTSTINHSSFGTRSSSNTLTPDKLHYVYSRLGAQYRMRRHILGFHGGMQYLYGAQGDLTTQVQQQFVSNATETTEYTWVVTDGLRKINWTADVSYGYQLTPKLFIQAGADFYFAPITVDDPSLTQEGYYWSGAYAPVHPFITLNFQIYEGH
jgi:hypothetical protein